jgi:hypothetical protein
VLRDSALWFKGSRRSDAFESSSDVCNQFEQAQSRGTLPLRCSLRSLAVDPHTDLQDKNKNASFHCHPHGVRVAAAAAQRPQQDVDFKPTGLEQVSIASTSCTGFYKTPSFKCAPVNVPGYMARAKDGSHKALVIVSPGAGGLDMRHSDYARQLADSGMNALVLDHWAARGMQNADADYQKARAKGGDAVNYARLKLSGKTHVSATSANPWVARLLST